MRIWPRMLTTMAGLALLAPALALAQGPDGRRGPGGPPPGAMFDFLGVREAHEAKVVKGAPYKAEAVTEITQSLADGNRIVRKTTSAVSRDSEGRTRRESNLAALGPLAPHDAPRLVFIQDPVAGTAFVLEPDSHTARKLSRPGGSGKGPHPDAASTDGGPGPQGRFGRPHEMGEGKWERQTENLGNQTLEGLETTGTRTTVTIPAGAIGNEKAITIVSERWVSPELQAVVLSTHRDPRFGETTYRLTGITRGEPDKSLFEVPSDYTVREGPPPAMRFRRAPGAEQKQ
ncbi:MAG: hypothetical protein DMF82_14955 [Acidobacteria bacterium]|nr:MAG: hypothetical protein DMF82_14955 [Acidobacteriota bacterium]